MRLHPVVIAALAGLIATGQIILASADALAESTHPAMTDPSKAKDTAPETFRAKIETTKGDILLDCNRSWAPNGADRFYNLIKIGFYEDAAFFRVAKGFVVQWGIHGNPQVSAKWRDARLPADPVKESNRRGTVTYAMSGNSNTTRTTQVFINFGDNSRLDGMGFAPICQVAEGGMEVAEKLYNEYGEKVSAKQQEIQDQGNAYLKEAWPELDYIKKTSIVSEGGKPGGEATPGTKSGDAPAEDDNTILYVIGAVGILAVAAFLFFRGRTEEPPPPPPRPAARKTGKAVTKKKRKKKRAG